MIQRFTYLLLRFSSGVGHWNARKLTGPGRFVLGGIVISAIVGIDTDLTMAYQAFALLLALFLVSLLVSVLPKIRFDAARTLPPFVTAGEGFKYRISITNLGRKIEKDLILKDNLADPRSTFDEYRMFRAMGKKQRVLGSGPLRPWQALISKNRCGDIPETKLPVLRSDRATTFAAWRWHGYVGILL